MNDDDSSPEEHEEVRVSWRKGVYLIELDVDPRVAGALICRYWVLTARRSTIFE